MFGWFRIMLIMLINRRVQEDDRGLRSNDSVAVSCHGMLLTTADDAEE